MTRKLVIAAFVLTLIAGIASNGTLKSERSAASANTGLTAPSTVSSVCDIPFITNVRIKNLGNSDFEVSWDYNPPDPCMKPDGFEVMIRIKRKASAGILGERTTKVGPLDRRIIFKFGSVFGIDNVVARVTGTITLKRFLAEGLDL